MDKGMKLGQRNPRWRSHTGSHGGRVVVGVVVGLLAALLLASTALAAPPTYDLQGTWSSGPLNSDGSHAPADGTQTVTQMNMTTGEFSGHSEVDGIAFELAGIESGTALEFTQSEGGYVAHDKVPVLSILPDGNVGGNGSFESGEFWMEVVSSSTSSKGEEEAAKKAKEEEAAKKAKEEAEKSAKRPSATMVTCNYEFATSENTCVAVVGDAGTGTPVTPTGSVTFTTTSGGFSGASCSLTPTSTSPSVANCTLVYETANSGLPEITATYGGDARHTPSVGHTQFLGAGSEEGTAETPPGKPGEYPNEIDLGFEVPTNGTTVEGAAQGSDPNPAPVPLTLPGLASLDSVSAADLKLVETDATKVDDSGAQNPGSVKEMNQSIEKLDQRTIEVAHSANPVEQAEAKTLTKDANEAIEAADKMLKQQEEVLKSISHNLGSVFVASRRKSAGKQKTKTIESLAHVVQDNVAAGKHKLALKLNGAELKKLAGKHSSVSVYVRVDMLLPSALYESGLPRVFVKRVTLKRTPGGKGHKPHKKP
jgi:hypothetical protein